MPASQEGTLLPAQRFSCPHTRVAKPGGPLPKPSLPLVLVGGPLPSLTQGRICQRQDDEQAIEVVRVLDLGHHLPSTLWHSPTSQPCSTCPSQPSRCPGVGHVGAPQNDSDGRARGEQRAGPSERGQGRGKLRVGQGNRAWARDSWCPSCSHLLPTALRSMELLFHFRNGSPQ